MYIQSSNPLLLTTPLSTITESSIASSDYDIYDMAASQQIYYKDGIDYSKMQRRDSGVDLSDPIMSQNIFHDFITEQEHTAEHDDLCAEKFCDPSDNACSLEPSSFFETLAVPSPTSSCEDYEAFGNNLEFAPKFFKIEDPSMANFVPLQIYKCFSGFDDVSDAFNVEVCNPASISPLPPSPISSFSDHNDCYMKNLSFDYQFAAHPGSLSPISPTADRFPFPAETDSDCNSLTSSSNPSSPEPSSPPSESMPMPLCGNSSVAEQSASQVTGKPQRSRGRRVSNRPDVSGGKLFTCKAPNCGKVFKRSEHLKRHHRSIHTSDKPFPCPIPTCSKRFSRSDNLNQHIRIHRHGKDSLKASGRHFSNFTPFYTAK